MMGTSRPLNQQSTYPAKVKVKSVFEKTGQLCQ